jgi:hypothetical protein
MNLPVNSTQCIVPGLCPEVATSLIRGLWLTTFAVCVAAISVLAAILSMST